MLKFSELRLKEGDEVKMLEKGDSGFWGCSNMRMPVEVFLHGGELICNYIPQKHWHELTGEWEVNGRRVYDYSGVKCVDIDSLGRTILGGDRITSAFLWCTTPQGSYYWEEQDEKYVPLDVEALKDMYVQRGGEPFWEDTFDLPPAEENDHLSNWLDDDYDAVTKPEHYNHADGGIECIEYIKQVLGLEGFVAYCRGNSIKYNHRLMYKGKPVEDMGKSIQYQKWAEEALKELSEDESE